ncbi:T-complex protein 1 subunit gamma [Cimex lectularius]|uniref:T-complex protein 1 subunit gamma n=1 Tax=Cimex lectularius TaxID=79782 RepID=A0A8I6THB6_CIMLE|nr:T-complex protein 1 subunit gamma [Cimex lectularius]
MMPILVLSHNTKRESGRKVQNENIDSAKAIADVIRTCLGPQAMLKMLMDPMGGIVMTNDGNCILREITSPHPAAKTMIEVARTQDEEVGDGTTSVIILAGEMLAEVQQYINTYHPVALIRIFKIALKDIMEATDKFAKEMDFSNRDEVKKVAKGCLGTKFLGQWADLACDIAYDAVNMVLERKQGYNRVDIKNFARIEKIPGGLIEDSQVLEGIMINKDVTHPQMKRKIENPRILLLDCPLEYKKGESQTNVEILKEGDFTRLLQIEEEYIEKLCKQIIAANPNLVFTEKGVSDLAQHYLVKAGITVIRRVRKMDNNRIARATNATIISRLDELQAHHIGTGAGLFEVKKMGDEYFTFLTKCKNAKACTILLRGPSKDVLNEVERNLNDALNVIRCISHESKVVPGGGAIEMMVKAELTEKHPEVLSGMEPYSAVTNALSIIPKILVQNSGVSNVIHVLAEFERRISHKEQVGINGVTGKIVPSEELNIWEPLAVKKQVYKTAIESAILLLRVDDIVSGAKNKDKESVSAPSRTAQPTEESMKE